MLSVLASTLTALSLEPPADVLWLSLAEPVDTKFTSLVSRRVFWSPVRADELDSLPLRTLVL